MEKEALQKLSDEELLIEKKKLRSSKIFHAFAIGFLAAVLVFGMVSWMMSSERRIGFFIPMIIPIVFIYKILKNPKQNKALEDVLKERGLD